MDLSSWITAVKRKSDQNANPVANPGWSRVRGSDRAGESGSPRPGLPFPVVEIAACPQGVFVKIRPVQCAVQLGQPISLV